MPLSEHTYDLNAVADRLETEMREYAEEQASFPRGSDGAKQAAEQGQQAQHYRAGVLWALGWPDDPDRDGARWDAGSVTLATMKNGERRMIRELADEKSLPWSDLYVAVASVDAPWVAHDSTAIRKDDLVETAINIADLHPHFADWLEHTVSELSGMGAEGNAYRQLVQATRTSET